MARPLHELPRRLVGYFRPAPIATAQAFGTFLAERAALLAQKCAIDYCRGKTGLASYALFTEKPFLARKRKHPGAMPGCFGFQGRRQWG